MSGSSLHYQTSLVWHIPCVYPLLSSRFIYGVSLDSCLCIIHGLYDLFTGLQAWHKHVLTVFSQPLWLSLPCSGSGSGVSFLSSFPEAPSVLGQCLPLQLWPVLSCPDPTRPTRWMHLGLVGVVKRCAYKLRLPALDPQWHVDLGCFSCTMRWMVTGEAIMDYISDRALATQPHSWPSLALLHWGCELTLTGYGANIRGSKNAQTHWATLLKCQTSMRQIFKSLTFGGATFKRPLMFLGLASQSPPVVLT